MNATPSPENLLQEIARIQQLEQGKLCILRQGPKGPYYNLQRWEKGRNVSQYVPADQVAAVQENLAAHAQFEALSEQYVQLLSERSRAQRLAGRATAQRTFPRATARRSQKKKRPPRKSFSPRKPKSSS